MLVLHHLATLILPWARPHAICTQVSEARQIFLFSLFMNCPLNLAMLPLRTHHPARHLCFSAAFTGHRCPRPPFTEIWHDPHSFAALLILSLLHSPFPMACCILLFFWRPSL